MHAGRSHPYHPNYWAAPAWFWPGHVPWKMKVSHQAPPDGLWDVLGDLVGAVSSAGVPSTDSSVIVYAMPLGVLPYGVGLQIELSRGGSFPSYTASWRSRLYYTGVLLGIGRANQSYPQTVVSIQEWTDTANVAGVVIGPPPLLTCVPANYVDGGSPWA